MLAVRQGRTRLRRETGRLRKIVGCFYSFDGGDALFDIANRVEVLIQLARIVAA